MNIRFIAVLLLTVFAAGRAAAITMQPGLQEMPLTSIPPAPPKITIDGKLDEWKGLTGYDYNPLERIVASGGDPAIAALLAHPISINFKTCYDSDALYVGLNWHDQKAGTNSTAAADANDWSAGGEGFELHLLTDRVLHLACWPTPGGLAVMARYDDQKTWQDISKSVTAAGAQGNDGMTYAEELRIPWSVVTAAGKLPGDGKVEMGVDFAWNAIPPSFVGHLRRAMWANDNGTPGVWASFLTARPALVSAGYLPNSSDWGTLNFDMTPTGDQTLKAPDGSTSISSFSVPPAKAPPSTDGTLGGWDPSYFQTASYLGALWGNRFSSQIAAQYDADNFYLAVHFATPGPSNLKAESTQQGFRGGDAFQLRLSDGTKKIALCGWYDSNAGKPALTVDDSTLPSPFLLEQGAQEGFKPDGHGGYIQTLALPWSVLLGSAPKSGSQLKATFQLWYADLSNRVSFHVKTTLEKRSALSVAYKMPADGELTLGLYDKGGRLLKWLAQDGYRYAGENQEPWDGLDQWGNPVPAGSYALKGIYHAPITTDYLATVCNPGNPPWPTPDDKGDWLSDEFDPQAAVTDGKWVYLAAPGCELGYSIIAVDETGQRQWGIRINNVTGRAVSLALSGNYLYALYSGCALTGGTHEYTGTNAIGEAHLVCYDKRTGKPVQFTLKQPDFKVASWPYQDDYTWLDVLRNNKSFTPQVYGGQARYYCTDVGEPTNALGMTVVGDKIYISLNYDNKLLVLDAATGQPTGDEIPIKDPVGLCSLDEHTLLAVSGKQIMKVDLAAHTAASFITSNLVAPDSITTDKAGNIYVSDWASSFQVKVFDSAGKFLHAIGKEGGRPWVGKWDPNGMLVPRGVAVTDEGKLWVAEDDGSPKRISLWDAKTGAFLKDYIGPTPYGGGTLFWIDPKDKTLVHTEGTCFKVDYAKKTYTPLSIDYRRQNRDDPFSPQGHNLDDRQGRVLYHDGHEYVINPDKALGILERKGDVYRPVAAFGNVMMHPNPDGTGVTIWDSLGHRPYKGYFPDSFIGHQGDNYSWTDLNGDNLVQPEELHWVKPNKGAYQDGTQPPIGGGWGWDVSPDWSYFFAGQYHDHMAIMRLDVKGWTKDGAPIYDMAEAKPIILLPPKHVVGNLHVTDDKKLIVAFSFEGIGLWNDSTEAISAYDLDGHPLWSIAQPKQLPGKEVYANGVIYDFHLPKLGDVFGTWLYHGSQRPFLITTDGLEVGTMLDTTLLGPASLRGESAVYYYQGGDGTPYIINGANQAEHIFQINGLNGATSGRFDGAYQLTDKEVELAAAMRAVPKQEIAPKPVLAVTWLSKPPAIDGDLAGWNFGVGASLDGGKGRTADIALGRDATSLYLAYKVHESNPPMRNEGADWRSLFISGDCVDLMLQTDPKADPNRRNAVAGDERLLFSLFQGKPIAVLYRPVVAGTTSPVSLASAQIDQVIQLDSAKVAIKRDPAQDTYTVEASVPLKDIGINPRTTDALRGDVGVIFADESGKSRALRLYYYNHHTEMIDDLATEATLQPSEWGRITMPLGPNLIQNGGFEDPFVDSQADMDKGWYISRAVNGNDASLSAESPYSGHQSLLLEASVPVNYAPEAYNDPDYAKFLKSANDGKGFGEVEVRQRVGVTAGHQYSVRFQFRCQDYVGDRKNVGHPRGYVSFNSRIEWVCPSPSPNHGKRTPLADPYNTQAYEGPVFNWYTVYDPQPFAPPAPYTAPEDAIAADLIISMRNATDSLPKFFFDDVEFVDVTPGLAIGSVSAR